MEIKKKELYLSPEVHIFEVKTEGVICGSGSRNSYGNGNEGVGPLDDSGNWIW